MDEDNLFCNVALYGVLMAGLGVVAVTLLGWWFQDEQHGTFLPMLLAGAAEMVLAVMGSALIVWRERRR